MKAKIAALICVMSAWAIFTEALTMAQRPRHWAIVVHGGAGDIDRAALGPERDKAYRAALSDAVKAGAAVLDQGGSSLDAVEAAVRVMEDDLHFNAARGAVFTAEGKTELDAAIMDGATMRAGAVADVTQTRYPITLARAVMEKTPNVFLVGPGADAFSLQAGMEQVSPAYFFTESRWQSLVKQLQKDGKPIPPRPEGAPAAQPAVPVAQWQEPADTRRFGTVGVVALDRQGNIAVGTSTGGLQGKMPGRVGDSPLIGAGTYASNQSCAVSGTGVGEFFIRYTVAREICALVQYKGFTLQQAADEVIHKQLAPIHGDGGVVAIAPDGQLAWSFNTPGMFRARQVEGGAIEVHIYNDEP
ncbi:MAG TPA: isoaspartyl peptidase/L-asparaginase [Terracidiphilus sp.]|nr:isoaspartyl peptidase/L-asparaginase [Terracidiphilus sp.]